MLSCSVLQPCSSFFLFILFIRCCALVIHITNFCKALQINLILVLVTLFYLVLNKAMLLIQVIRWFVLITDITSFGMKKAALIKTTKKRKHHSKLLFHYYKVWRQWASYGQRWQKENTKLPKLNTYFWRLRTGMKTERNVLYRFFFMAVTG